MMHLKIEMKEKGVSPGPESVNMLTASSCQPVGGVKLWCLQRDQRGVRPGGHEEGNLYLNLPVQDFIKSCVEAKMNIPFGLKKNRHTLLLSLYFNANDGTIL